MLRQMKRVEKNSKDSLEYLESQMGASHHNPKLLVSTSPDGVYVGGLLSDSSDRIAKRVENPIHFKYVSFEGGEERSKKLPVSNLRVFVAMMEEGGILYLAILNSGAGPSDEAAVFIIWRMKTVLRETVLSILYKETRDDGRQMMSNAPMELQVNDLEETQLFYFQARGIDLETARKALVFSSGAESYKSLCRVYFWPVPSSWQCSIGVSCLQTMRRDVVLPSKCKIIADFFRCFKAVTVMNYGGYPNCSR
ncbi:hypothetical protein DKX38_004257 [Salix brachista]|uniref:Uncharacterized protein n=1 Tax=Salix brachista TaxID=2182728 RepID=A0A5N5NC45_9ROSI|nr:hypothetical protein DKX38_004257 [Salix brachista]